MRCAELSSSRSPYSTDRKSDRGTMASFAATPTAELVIIGIGNRMSEVIIRQTWDCVRAADLSPI